MGDATSGAKTDRVEAFSIQSKINLAFASVLQVK
jgi:hypothetical protein